MHTNYSIIIPAHNSSKFIATLLDSIPRRKDVEIIIVDDHSSDYAELKNVISKHSQNRNIELLRNTNDPSAGAARNVGLEMAAGTWLIFADSDDYFTGDFAEALDKYADSSSDIVLFSPVAVTKDSNSPSNRADFFKQLYNQYASKQITTEELSYRLTPVWSKFYKRSTIDDIRFNTTAVANDVAFSLKAAFTNLKKIAVDASKHIYTVVERTGSITRHKRRNIKRLYTRSMERIRADSWLRQRLKLAGEKQPDLARQESIFRKFYDKKKA